MVSQLSLLTVELQVTVLNGILSPLLAVSMAEAKALKATCHNFQNRPTNYP